MSQDDLTTFECEECGVVVATYDDPADIDNEKCIKCDGFPGFE